MRYRLTKNEVEVITYANNKQFEDTLKEFKVMKRDILFLIEKLVQDYKR